ncbi:MAG: hypothetical protein AB7I50_26040 [Vicinamibacterales bacterium]
MSRRDFDLTPWSHGMALDDPDAIFAEFYLPGSPRNYSQISSPEIEEAYVTQSQEQDPERRREDDLELREGLHASARQQLQRRALAGDMARRVGRRRA